MADSQRFAVAVHMLMILAAHKAGRPGQAVTSGEMAKSVNANPVVLRRVISALAQAGVVATRAGANGGVWLARQPQEIALDCVRQAVDDGPVVCCRTNLNDDCPVAQAAAGSRASTAAAAAPSAGWKSSADAAPARCWRWSARRASARPRWVNPWPAPWAATSSGSPWAASGTRPRSAVTAAPTSARCQAGSSGH